MLRSILFFCTILLLPLIAISQAVQVTNVHGTLSLDPPILDVHGTTARIVHGTNFYYYAFPVSGPSVPFTAPPKPDSSGWGPNFVEIGGTSTDVYVPYIDFNTSTSTYDVKYVSSTNNGTSWSAPVHLGSASGTNTITLYTDNLLFKVSANGNQYCVWRDQGDTNRIKLAHPSPGTSGSIRVLPIGDTTSAANVVSMDVISVGGTDNLILSYNVDSSLYVIRSTDGGTTFTSPVRIAYFNGVMGYYSSNAIVGLPNGKLYAMYSYWAMLSHSFGGEPDTRVGTVLYRSQDFGATWSFVDTLFRSSYVDMRLALTSTGTLVMALAETADVFIKTSLDGKSWTAPVRVNPNYRTAAGKYETGYSMKLIDDNTAALAWIDTTTGYDEIFYRSLAIPAAPAVRVESSASGSLPARTALDAAYPNPFNPSTTIRYLLAERANVSLKVYDLIGRPVATLVEREQSPGEYTATWNASGASSGVYFCRLEAAGRTYQTKLLLLK